MHRIQYLLASALFTVTALAGEGPVPKEGLLISKAQAAEVRARILGMKGDKVLEHIRVDAEKAVSEWPGAKENIEKHVGEFLDVIVENNPKGFLPEAAASGKTLETMFKHCSAKLGFMYFLTGDQRYADTAYEILDMAGRVPRWGWFNWSAANMPQIHYGMCARSAAFCMDFCWNGWDKQRQERVAQIIADHVVEPYWRIVSLPPFMAFHHLRSLNQGNNALSGALVGAVALGDSVPDNKLWFNSLLQTYSWIVAHDIGWAGTNLESGAYWEVSMCNLYTAAACLNNAKGIDFRSHPSFAEATWYPIMKEATVPPVHAPFDKPYPKDVVGAYGIIQHKPIEMPGDPQASPWWYDYAAQFPNSPAAYFIAKTNGRMANPHQDGHFELLQLLWAQTLPKQEMPAEPTMLFKVTDREAMFRSGYGSPHTFLSFNGDFFLSSRNEMLCASSGLAWHFPWHQFAVTESVLETEGQPFSPSMLITDSFDSPFVSAIATKSASTNVKYYLRQGQADSYKAYKSRTRDIVYVRSDKRDQVYDYFLFVDRVAHDGAKWHAFNWHLWNHKGNEGSYETIDAHTMLAHRPNAAVLLSTLSHDQVGYEQQNMPAQPPVRYSFDRDVALLRSFPGGLKPVNEEVRKIPIANWSAGEAVVDTDGKQTRYFTSFKALKPVLKCPITLTPGVRYKLSVQSRKKDAWVDEAQTYALDITFQDDKGATIRALSPDQREPDPQRLSDPASSTQGVCGWREATTVFDAPAGVAGLTAELKFAQSTNNGPGINQKSELWISDIEISPVGEPARRESDVVVTLVMPLENNGPRPEIHTKREGNRIQADVVHPDKTRDRIVVDEDGRIEVTREGGGGNAYFGRNVAKVALGKTGELTATSPMCAAIWEKDGKTSGEVSLSAGGTAALNGASRSLDAGVYQFDGEFKRDANAVSLKANSDSSQAALKAGLAPVNAEIAADRDKYIKQGMKNIAVDAEVSASASLDPRFKPEHVVDNQTSELPTDGVLDYTLGEIQTPGNGGYGGGQTPYTSNMSTYPLYIRPTYWLLPYRQPGSITLKLKNPTALKLVRLLNTTNAGLNDFATIDFTVELLNEDGSVAWSKPGSFGKVQDGAFKSAFVRPAFFKAYGETFQGMLAPGDKVPFGTGWQEINVDHPGQVYAVRVNVQSFWGLGGGLNEVQVYP